MNLTGRTKTGRRPHNEDAYLVANRDGRCFAAVSDGMGGHAAGETASRIAIDTLDRVLSAADRIDEAVIRDAFVEANRAVFEAAAADEAKHGMGATLVCAVLNANTFLAANVGDSRLYQYHEGTIHQVSHDHSFVAELVRRKLITSEEAKSHPRRNLITRAIGTESSVKVDLFSCEWTKNDILLLCSDGLSGCLGEDELIALLNASTDLDETCAKMIEQAYENGSTDNITAVLVKNTEDAQ